MHLKYAMNMHAINKFTCNNKYRYVNIYAINKFSTMKLCSICNESIAAKKMFKKELTTVAFREWLGRCMGMRSIHVSATVLSSQ